MSEEWSIGELARMSGLSTRTLRHWDAKGLLTPVRTDAGRVRYYGRAELLRLQEIVLYRRMAMSLDSIRSIVDGHTDHVDALRGHRERLRQAREHVAALERTVASTIAQLEGDEAMEPATWFDRLDGETVERYEAEARTRWGDERVDRSRENLEAMTDRERDEVIERFQSIVDRLARLYRDGAYSDDTAVDTVIGDHYSWLSGMWEADREAYVGLGRLYADDERFARQFDAATDGLAAFTASAMEAWAQRHLS
ncbi:MerR family transcriptional regulator [Haloglycomyces albus]|uniref:MerR family transcriptional regulator n=1 Tax=Haloglycomyces albus TaxID=526067 RepID=UPI00046D6D20|nr:MerR family transcriptional regulator [Haloglycomyces albus]